MTTNDAARGGTPIAADSVHDSDIAGLDRPGIWTFMWKMRRSGSSTADVHEVCYRWEKLTGRRYRDGEETE